MFNVDWSIVVNWLMPPVLRRAFNLAYLNALLIPFNYIYNLFLDYRNTNIYTLSHSGQVCYLQGALNDAFDIAERRIYIDDAGQYNVTLINLDADNDPLYLDDDAHGAFIIHNDSAYAGGNYDFIVFLPVNLIQSEIYRLQSIVNYYKLAGKRYDINMPISVDPGGEIVDIPLEL